MLKLPIAGFARRIPDTVERDMAILKDRPDPAQKPQPGSPTNPSTARPHSRSSR
ncbi:hypothetical protein [Microvirga yunnanensis]|uniref:hypothetical protein n=1 Tax=Microvirga yunnanensis TaxID=2953740 RepID=UPI0021C8EEA4|nr:MULTISPECIES: hypothetical protein [unclassified Microvirga]